MNRILAGGNALKSLGLTRSGVSDAFGVSFDYPPGTEKEATVRLILGKAVYILLPDRTEKDGCETLPYEIKALLMVVSNLLLKT